MKTGYGIISLIIAATFVGCFCRSAYPQDVTDTVRKTQRVVVRNLGPNVNSKTEDFGAYIMHDGLSMYFVTRRFSSRDHFYMVKRPDRDSTWGESEYFKILNNQDIAGGIAFDDSGRVYCATNKETVTNNDVNIWEGKFFLGAALNMKVLPSPVKSLRWESQPTITRNGANLYFASNRGSSVNAFASTVDIFVSHRSSDGSWSEPNNIGPHINFGRYNATPFISPDGSFLFFTSGGKSDSKKKLYMSSRTGPNDDNWSDAVLLPSEINSEFFFE
jgi:hypothetical protein